MHRGDAGKTDLIMVGMSVSNADWSNTYVPLLQDCSQRLHESQDGWRCLIADPDRLNKYDAEVARHNSEVAHYDSALVQLR